MDGWTYQYGIGGILFAAGVAYAWRQGDMGPTGRGLRNLLVALAGLAFFAALQAWLQYGDMSEAAPVPHEGGFVRKDVIGTPLDYGIMAAYFVAILVVGTWFGKGQKTTKDFFFGGQRFSWWLITFSLIATTVGSYSFVKYSSVAYTYGLSSTQTYLNDWLWFPLLAFGWLPILYFSRVVSVPEYFQRRFDRRARKAVTWLLLVYLVGYVGVNLYTMGVALQVLVGWDVLVSASIVAAVSAVYVTAGGQTSVIMTDLFQGVMLLATGLLLLVLGADYLGGYDLLWDHLPRGHRTAFPSFNEDPAFNAAGIFWQDAVANSAMFYFLNQGVAMRFMAARSVGDARKALVATLVVLMPIAAIVVASGGWVGRSLVHAGVLPPDLDSDEVFFVAAELLSRPGIFGLVMAALTAALMSTVDTLITAIAAIVVNDVYRPAHPEAGEERLLGVARFTSVGITLVGIALVPVFMMFDSIYAAHGAFTAAVTPPLVVALLFGVFWRRYTATAAVWTIAGGGALMAASVFWPALVSPFSLGVPAKEIGDGLLEGAKQYVFTRALFGLVASAAVGIVATFLTRPAPESALRGLVWGTVADAIRHYKGSPGTEIEGPWRSALPVLGAARAVTAGDSTGTADLKPVRISAALAASLGGAAPGDLLYVTDRRVWLGGLRSTHARLIEIADLAGGGPAIELGPGAWEAVAGERRAAIPVRVRKLY